MLLDGKLAAAKPKQLRYRLLHVARLIRSGRRLHLRIDKNWPWRDPSSPLTPGSPHCRGPLLPDCRFRSYEPARRRRPSASSLARPKICYRSERPEKVK